MRWRQRRRDGDDHPAGVHVDAVAVHGDAARGVHDAPDRRAQVHPVAERVRHPQREQLRTAAQARLLGTAADVEQLLDRPDVLAVARGGDVAEHEQQRQITRLGAEECLQERSEQAEDAIGLGRVLAHEGLERLPVPVGGAARRPRLVDRHLRGHLVDQRDQRGDVLGDEGVRRRGAQRRGVAVGRPRLRRVEVDVVAGVIGVERADAEVLGQREHAVLGRADELSTRLGDVAAPEVVVQHPAAHPVARLQHHDPVAVGGQPTGGGEPGQPGADHGDVGVQHSPAGGAGSSRRIRGIG